MYYKFGEFMIPKKRLIKAVKHEEPDRVPVVNTLTPASAQKVSNALNLPFERINNCLFNDQLVALGNDAILVGADAPIDFRPPVFEDGSYLDEWGIRYKKIGVHNEMIKHPLRDIENLDQMNEYFHRHKFPNPYGTGRFDLAKRQIAQYGNTYAVIGLLQMTMFESSWYMVGLEKYFMDLARGNEYIFALLDRMIQYHLTIGKQLIDLGCDIIWIGDDFGDQDNMLISPDMFRRIFKPRFKMVIEELKRYKSDILVAYHSCGMIAPIIQDLIEIKIDILHPIQPVNGMDRVNIKKASGDRLTLWGCLSIQDTLPFGSESDVQDEIKRIIRDTAKGGGFVLGAAHHIQADTPIENILAIYDTVKTNGKYPIML
jgi:uroporphyrinogen decarboxylase